MKAVDYSKLTLDELFVMDKVDICQVEKHFKDALISLDSRFMSFKAHSRRLIVGQWVVFIDFDASDKLTITKTQKIAEILQKEYLYNPQQVNDFIDNIKKERIRVKKGYTLVIDGNFAVYDKDTSTFSDTLLGSCMNRCSERYYDLQNCLENPDDLQICSVWDYEDNLVARTLIWKGTHYDRIYANNSAIVKYVQFVLMGRGFNSVYYAPADRMDVPLSKELGDYPVPYMDSVCFYSENPHKISTRSLGHISCLQETDGESCFDRQECTCCGEYTLASNAYYIYRHGEFVCSSCSDQIVFTADTLHYEYLDDCVQVVDSDSEWYYNSGDLYYAEDTGEYYVYSDELYYAEDTKEWFSDSDNLYYAEDTELYYKYSNDLYFTEDTKEWFESADDLFYNEEREIYIKGDL